MDDKFVKMDAFMATVPWNSPDQGAKTEVWIGSMKGLLRCAPWTKPGVSNNALAQSHLFLESKQENKRTPTNFGSIHIIPTINMRHWAATIRSASQIP